MQHSQQLNEGLRPLDLENLVDDYFEIDTYKSKMGEDRDVCVLSFRCKDRNPAQDLMEFIEKGYSFVLDADVSSGENKDGEYFVFVELKRSPKLAEEIKEITYGVRRLTGIPDWDFRYYKESTKKPLSLDMLKESIPLTPQMYDQKMNFYKTEDVKKFFSKTLMNDLTFENDIITIYKPFNKVVKLRLVKEDSKDNMLKETSQPLQLDNTAMGEIFWLTKILGDYTINKVEQGFVFENGNRAMILQRIEI